MENALNKRFKKISKNAALVFIVVLLFPKIIYAKAFVLDLYFDKNSNQIFLDKDGANQVRISDNFFDPAVEPKSQDYYANLLSSNGSILLTLNFTPIIGKFALEIPYYETVYKIELYNKENSLLLIDTSGFASCNLDNACQSALGENESSCVHDCSVKTDLSKFSQPTPPKQPTGELSKPLTNVDNSQSSETTTPVKTPFLGLIIGLVMIIGGAGYGVYRLIKGRKEE